MAEEYADALPNAEGVGHLLLNEEVIEAWEAAGADWGLVLGDPLRWAKEYSTWAAARATLANPESREGEAQAALLRDIFGPLPFRDVTADAACLTPAVLALSRAAYEHRMLPEGHLDPARLSVLAAALEAAGRTDAELLGHLRWHGPHVRGCFALDLLLGRG